MKQNDFSDIFDGPIDSQLAEDVTQLEAIYNAAEQPAQLSWTRFQFQARQSSPLRHIPAHSFQSYAKERHFKRWPIFTAAAVLLVALVGTGLFSPVAGWFGASQSAYAYAQVNQSSHNQGITLNVIQAYASASITSIVFQVNLPSDMAKSHPIVMPGKSTLVSQQREETWKAWAIGPEHDLAAFSAIQPSAGAQNVTLTWSLTELDLTSSGNLVASVHGNWTFTFTIPFHHDQQFPPVLPGKYWILSGDHDIFLRIASQEM